MTYYLSDGSICPPDEVGKHDADVDPVYEDTDLIDRALWEYSEWSPGLRARYDALVSRRRQG